MLQQIKLPSMGATMEEGTIVSWKVKEGDAVKTGQVLLELESDKSVFEYESPCDGLIRKILAIDGETLAVQSTIAVIGDAGDAIPAEWLVAAPAAKSAAAAAAIVTPTVPAAAAAGAKFDKGGPKISPRARKLAEQLGVDIAQVAGSGPGGRIESADVEKAAHTQPLQSQTASGGATQAGDSVIPFDPVRLAINRTVVKSKQEIPHFYIGATIDASRLMAYRQRHSAQGQKLSVNAIFMKAVARGLAAEPSLNVAITGTGYRRHPSVNVGLAIETPKGVFIAVVEDVDKHDIVELSAQIGKLVAIVRDGSAGALRPAEACMTISNVGMYRADWFIPIIRPGDAAILGIGSIVERPVVVKDEVVIRSTAPVTLCMDHRIADGAAAARFLKAFAEYLEQLE
ncbi:MAG: 2-oxo acid dehydrogenase subunit E2 [Verrucomicrobia bacterium]|nr:2-oxo acid dehydrogenase subunit E2 [Verrucomicrobiota bacterium]